MGGVSGQATDVSIHAQEILRIRELLDEILALHTGQTLEKIRHDTERDFIMTVKDAVEYGIIDDIIESKKLKASSE